MRFSNLKISVPDKVTIEKLQGEYVEVLIRRLKDPSFGVGKITNSDPEGCSIPVISTQTLFDGSDGHSPSVNTVQ